jgi:hypothetical protein
LYIGYFTGNGIYKAATTSLLVISAFQSIENGAYGLASSGGGSSIYCNGITASNTSGNYTLSSASTLDYIANLMLSSGAFHTSLGPGPTSG